MDIPSLDGHPEHHGLYLSNLEVGEIIIGLDRVQIEVSSWMRDHPTFPAEFLKFGDGNPSILNFKQIEA